MPAKNKDDKKTAKKSSVPVHKCPYCDVKLMAAPAPYCVACSVQFISCPSCGADFSRDQDICPQCGAENRKPVIGI